MQVDADSGCEVRGSSSLREAVYDRLKRAILAFEVRPGQILSANAISQELSVSRTPVREALQLLERDGLLRSVTGRGMEVVGISKEDAENVFDVREILECRVARISAIKIDAAGKAELGRVVERARAAAEMRDAIQWAETDRALHTVLWQATGNDFLHQVLVQARDRTQRIAIYDVTRLDRLHASTEELDLIASAVVSGDPDAAEVAMKAHIQALRESVLSLFPKTAIRQLVI